jgi:hypothetical protein
MAPSGLSEGKSDQCTYKDADWQKGAVLIVFAIGVLTPSATFAAPAQHAYLKSSNPVFSGYLTFYIFLTVV